MSNKLGLVIVLFALTLLCIVCVTDHGVPIAGAIRAHVYGSLQAASISKLEVGVNGRDITLNGTAASQQIKERAGDLALAASGVRVVDNRIIVAEADAKTVQTSLNKILLDKKIEFATDRDELLPQSLPVLENIAKVLGQASYLRVQIEGHTDALGDPEANRQLSQARAQAVMAWMSNHGIAQDRMTAVGFGSTKPIATNATSEGRYMNRRVEIIAQETGHQ